jgi:sn-glycerol 3-phosphate transport system ATP-binding protein
MAHVTLQNVCKTYPNGFKAIHGVDVEIVEGEFIVLVGPSGCGKSTLLRMIAGLERITEGTITIGERVVNDLEPADRDIAMVFQNYALYPHMNVFQNMAYGLKIRKLPKAEIEARVKKVADILNLTDEQMTRKPRELSGGQRQRVAMGRAIVREPSVFLFDEPLSNLDAKLRVQMRIEIKQLQDRLGITSVYVTHDQVEAMTLAQRMIVMNAGRVEQVGTPLDVYAKPATTFVAGFIGSPAMNLIPEVRDGRKILFGIRPEHLEPCAQGDANFVIDVDLIEPLGADTLIYGHLDGAASGVRIAARLHASIDARTGKLPLRYDSDKVHRFDAGSGQRIE